MARPRVFVSSTYYDLKHLRSSIENFIESLGYDPILSEKGDIAYAPDTPLDESCYREVRNADIFVIIIGGRYGSEKSEGKPDLPKKFFDRYDSITKQEYGSAVEQDIPIFILIEKSVYSEFETYLRNKDNQTITYAHVDSINIFHLIEEILAQPRNNPIQQFDRYSDIEFWLREQWAGLFREMLNRLSSQQQISSLASQVSELAEINKTLKTYLEEVVAKIAPDESARLIKSESARLQEAQQLAKLESSSFAKYIHDTSDIPYEKIYETLVKVKSPEEFASEIVKVSNNAGFKTRFPETFSRYRPLVIRDLNRLRKLVGLNEFVSEDSSPKVEAQPKASKKGHTSSKRKPTKRKAAKKG